MELTLRELLYDEEFIAKLYGWSYNHMYDKVNTEELCQEIILQLLIASQTVEYNYSYAYIWKIAENTYNRTTRQSYKHRDNAEYEAYMNVNANFIVINSSDVAKITNEIKVIVKDYVTEAIADLKSRKDEIMGAVYLNPPKSFEFILWTIVPFLTWRIQEGLHDIVENHFNIENEEREFKIVGIAHEGDFSFNMYGCNGVMNDQFHFRNFIGYRLPWGKPRFDCTETVPEYMMFTGKCIGGLSKDDVAKEDIEACAKAIDVGYIKLADDGKHYPEIIIYDKNNYYPAVPRIAKKYSDQLGQTFIDAVKKYVPEHMMNQKDIFVDIMACPLTYYIIEEAINQGFLYIPEGDTIIEGIWAVKK